MTQGAVTGRCAVTQGAVTGCCAVTQGAVTQGAVWTDYTTLVLVDCSLLAS